MLDTLISSKTRIKLLLKFFLNTTNKAHLRGLEAEFGESSNAIRQELNRLEVAGLLNSVVQGNKKLFSANTKHPLFKDINSILFKYTGLDRIVEQVLGKLGDLERVYLVGDLGRGVDSPIIDLIIVGNINKEFLARLTEKAEAIIDKKLRYATFTPEQFNEQKDRVLPENNLLIWNQ
ncbi:MAG: ArsR family transcriptional regulator [Bacteroidota bacterium]